jgi:glycosyltransferase involved in cell wall biosynthesis
VTILRNICGELRGEHEIAVYATASASSLADLGQKSLQKVVDGYTVKYFPRNLKCTRFNISVAMGIALRNSMRNFDIVHVHSWRQFQDMMVHHYSRKFKVPYVLQAHGALPLTNYAKSSKILYDRFFGQRVLNDASSLIASSELEAEQYEKYRVHPRKIHIIPPGVNSNAFVDQEGISSFKAKFSIDVDSEIVLYLGRVHRLKGIDFLIRSFSNFVRTFPQHKNVLLVIAGPDDGFLNEAVHLAKTLQIQNRIIFTGMLTQKDKVAAMMGSRMVVSPEKSNVFLIVPLEAAAAGRPVIVSKSNYVSHTVEDRGFGISVEYGDVTGLAKSINYLVENPNISRILGNRGREFVVEDMNWARVARKYEKVYIDAVSNN